MTTTSRRPPGARALSGALAAVRADRDSRPKPESSRATRWLRIIAWVVIVVLGSIQMWSARFVVDSDGLSYLDLGDAYLHGRWTEALNAFWSPLYACLIELPVVVLGLPARLEAPAAHAVTLGLLLAAFACFDWLLRELWRQHRQWLARRGHASAGLPEWAFIALGVPLFAWSALRLITVANVAPDMCVAAVAYAATALIIRMRRGVAGLGSAVALGIVLGLGYLAKTAMFPLAAVFLAVALAATRDRIGRQRVVVAGVAFAVTALPFVVAISVARGRATFGDTGRWNYARYVGGTPAPVHWQGDGRSGVPVHPSRQVLRTPAVYEFGTPLRVTYPPWYDPFYWYDGVRVRLDLGRQLAVLRRNATEIVRIALGMSRWWLLVVAGLVVASRPYGEVGRTFARQWPLLIPAVSACALYALVHVEPRYLAPFLTLGGIALLPLVRAPDALTGRRLFGAAALTGAVAWLAGALRQESAPARQTWRELAGTAAGAPDTAMAVATALQAFRTAGESRATPIAYVGNSYHFHWARLARMRVVAEVRDVHDSSVAQFWNQDAPNASTRAIDALTATGARLVVTDSLPQIAAAAWHRLGRTSYYALPLGQGIDGATRIGERSPRSP